MFEEFLFAWLDRLRKLEEHSSISVKMQKEVDRCRAVAPVLKCVRGEQLWLDLFRLVSLPGGTTLETAPQRPAASGRQHHPQSPGAQG
ncbi:cytoplasmic dynein 2 heavy chain 1-like [Cyprinus carpio]|uniref:Cytoplasmic dynein 2 heavy chain 1-like n=1 Tax=Cyprinus carpio TaxID=7962 RepID=A0A9R0ADZ2_CYPCA|nr:cytoplasmic dynein 2 heavy chain 1-like [Cyprinus carpio]